jgi:asparagine synthase (glutamine-hydrolysing)
LCGIAGIFYKNRQGVISSILKKMTRSLIHRGPDEEGYYIEDNVGLGHRRLSIIDLSTGQQPLCNEDKSIWITFNGEIYNYLSLKKELEQKGHIFKTNSDTETIIHAYEEWGTDVFSRLRGMFALALWDEKHQEMVLARDRLGKKPLYYLSDDEKLLFGSEIKAILQHPGIDKSIDYTAFSDFISLMYIPNPKTIYKSIRKLPPGHFAIIKKDHFETIQYWDLSFYRDAGLSEKKITDVLI